MSYILDALRRSEEERHQEQLKSLTGHDGLIHVSRQKAPVWPYLLIGVLALNAVIFIWLHFHNAATVEPLANSEAIKADAVINKSDSITAFKKSSDVASNKAVNQISASTSGVEAQVQNDRTKPVQVPSSSIANDASAEQRDDDVYIDGALLIQPKGQKRQLPQNIAYTQASPNPTVTIASQPLDYDFGQTESSVPYLDVPRLIDMDRRFQKSVPNLTFNSHIYSDNPAARRVMINNIYLSEGQMLSGMEVVMIGEADIVFKKGDTLFKRGVMRDW